MATKHNGKTCINIITNVQQTVKVGLANPLLSFANLLTVTLAILEHPEIIYSYEKYMKGMLPKN